MQPNKPLEGHTYPLRIEGYSSDGAGVAGLDGMVVFVQGGVRGELPLRPVGRGAGDHRTLPCPDYPRLSLL